MVQNFDPKSAPFLTALSAIESHIARTSRAISSGLKVERPSDSPGDVSRIVSLQQRLSLSAQFRKNLDSVKVETNAADQALQQADVVLNSALSLGLQGANSNSVAQRPAIAQQIRLLQQALVNLSSTQANGSYVFSGDSDQTAPYRLDPSSSTGVERLVSSPSTRLIQDPAGTTFAPSLTAQDIFDHRLPDDTPANDNIFASVNRLATALEGNDAAGIDNALSLLRGAQTYLNTMLSHYGAVESQIENAIVLAGRFEVDGSSALSKVRETDIAEASTELAQAKVQRDAAMSVQSNIRRTSLFDYLK